MAGLVKSAPRHWPRSSCKHIPLFRDSVVQYTTWPVSLLAYLFKETMNGSTSRGSEIIQVACEKACNSKCGRRLRTNST